MMMINLTNFDTSIRGGPASSEDQIEGGGVGQFDTLLGALTFLPVAAPTEDGAPVAEKSEFKALFAQTGPPDTDLTAEQLVQLDTADKVTVEAAKPGTESSDFIPPELTPGPFPAEQIPSEPPNPKAQPAQGEKTSFDVDTKASPAEPEVVWEGFERKIDTKTKQAEPTTEMPVPTQQDPQRTSRLPPLSNRAFQIVRGTRLVTPPFERHDIPTPEIPVDMKKNGPVVETPPIIILPQEASGARPFTRLDTKGLDAAIQNETAAPSAVPQNVNTSVSDSPEILYPAPSGSPAQEFISTEAKLLSGDRKSSDKDGILQSHRAEAGKLTEAIFQKFAVNADKAIRPTVVDIPADGEPLIEQLGKPILEVTETMLEDGEPVILKFRLKPAELGNVEIRLERNGAGKLNIAFQTENDWAHRVLHDSFHQLRESLKDSGWQINDLNISSRASMDNSLNQQQNGNGKFQNQPSVPTSNTDDPNGESIIEPTMENDSPERLVSLMA